MRKKNCKVPAHLIEEAVRFCHSVELMFVLLQKIHITLLWDKLQQLMEQNIKNSFIYISNFHLYSFLLNTEEGFVY